MRMHLYLQLYKSLLLRATTLCPCHQKTPLHVPIPPPVPRCPVRSLTLQQSLLLIMFIFLLMSCSDVFISFRCMMAGRSSSPISVSVISIYPYISPFLSLSIHLSISSPINLSFFISLSLSISVSLSFLILLSLSIHLSFTHFLSLSSPSSYSCEL